MNTKIILLMALAIFALPLAYADGNGTGTVGVNITSTNQISVYVEGNNSRSALYFKGVAPPAALNITLRSDVTTDMADNVTGFIVENQGNVNVTIGVASTLNASELIGGTNPEFKMWAATTNESNSCMDGMPFAGFDLNLTSQTLCGKLLYPDTTDTVYAYMRINIWSDATPTYKQATITFTSTQNMTG